MASFLALLHVACYLVTYGMSQTLEEHHRSLIINGQVAAKGRYPYFCSLEHYGGGALIAPDVILTAGHCKPRRHNYVTPRVGTFSLKNDVKGVDYEEFEIDFSVRHLNFVRINADEFVFDFALLKLKGQSTHAPIKINRNDNIPFPDETVVAMGMGDTNPHKPSASDVLRQVHLTTISNNECSCAASQERNLTYANRIHPSMICTTGGPHNERDSCNYDSGSPIILPGKKEDLLVGLVSWGQECADPDFPAVNARVSYVSDWIDDVVCSISEHPPADFCQKQEWPLSTTILVIVVSSVVVIGIVIVMLSQFRRRQQRHDHDKVLLSETSSLCESTSSSEDGNYRAVEIM